MKKFIKVYSDTNEFVEYHSLKELLVSFKKELKSLNDFDVYDELSFYEGIDDELTYEVWFEGLYKECSEELKRLGIYELGVSVYKIIK